LTIDRNIPILCILVGSLALAQELQFQLQPSAFPVEIQGWQMFQPWTGGLDVSTPELCDLDGDGDLDYFSGSSDNFYWYFENIGTADSPDFIYISSYFDSLLPLGVTTSTLAWSDIDFIDIDADGDYDALMSNGIMSININQGTNHNPDFSAPADTLFTQTNQYLLATNFASVDIDADGDYDIIAGTYYSGGLTLYENIGTPQSYQYNLVTQNWQGILISEGMGDPCFGDLDDDGDLDLLVGNHQGKIRYYRNDGSAQNPQMTFISDYFCGIDVGEEASPELADIDGDGDLDLFVGRNAFFGQTTSQGDVFFFENIGTAQVFNFQYVTSNYLVLDCGYSCTPRLVDIDEDEDFDLFSHIGSNLLLYRNQGTIVEPLFIYETSSFGGISVFDLIPWFCDIDNDTDYDLFAGSSAIPGPPGLYLFKNQGTPQNPDYVLFSNNLVPGIFNISSVLLVPGTADIDADGDQDLFVSDDNGAFYFFENVGTPQRFQFLYQTDNWQNLHDGVHCHRQFCFYDIDHDTDLDLFYEGIEVNPNPPPDYKKTLRFYRNVGTPQNADMVLEVNDMFPELMIYQAAPFVTDIDRDGDGDLFVGDQWGGCRFFRNMEIENAHTTEVTISISGSDIVLHWQAVAEADSYKVYYQSIPYFTPSGIPQAVVVSPDTSWTDENAINQGKRYYRVVVEY
jgi:hypothetical protein